MTDKILSTRETQMSETFEGSATRHGTLSGYTKHQRLGEKPCPACDAAKQAYDVRYRSAPDRARKNRQASTAQARAKTRLVRAHPDEYRALYTEELERVRSEQPESDATENTQ